MGKIMEAQLSVARRSGPQFEQLLLCFDDDWISASELAVLLLLILL